MTSEFDFIHYIKKSFGFRAIGDDCAVLPKDDASDLLVTADLLIEIAARNELLKTQGYDAAKEFALKVDEQIARNMRATCAIRRH